MTMAPVRPIFENGQRLTAERLNQALEFVRGMLRRTLLAPLSSGVAAGFDLDPPFLTYQPTLTVHPGLAIDGRGNLLMLTQTKTFTADEIVQAVGGVISKDETVRVSIAPKTNTPNPNNPCATVVAGEVSEELEFVFEKFALGDAVADAFERSSNPNCVPAWGDLDQEIAGNAGCFIPIGHVTLRQADTEEPSYELTSSTFYRQGVNPRFGVIRNTDGTPSIGLVQLEAILPSSTKFESPGEFQALSAPEAEQTGFAGAKIDEPGVIIPVSTLFGPKPVAFRGPTGGIFLQSTHVSPYLAPYAAGTFSGAPGDNGDGRVFEFTGGAGVFGTDGKSELSAGLGGVAAVPCEIVTTSPVLAGGVPLALVDNSAQAAAIKVQVKPATSMTDTIIGLSAGKQYNHVAQGTPVVPVAMGGIVKVSVDTSGLAIGVGQDLSMSATAPHLRPSGPGQRIIARAAQTLPAGLTTPVEMMAWVVPASLTASPSGVQTRVESPRMTGTTDHAGVPGWSTTGGVPVVEQEFRDLAIGGVQPAVGLALDSTIDGATLTSASVRLQTTGATPEKRPRLDLVQLDENLTNTSLGSVTDTASPYGAFRDLTISDISIAIDATSNTTYYLLVDGAAGVDATGDVRILSVRSTYTLQ